MELFKFQFCWQLEEIISKLVTHPVSPEWQQNKQTSWNIWTMKTKPFSSKVKITQQNSQGENMEGFIHTILFFFLLCYQTALCHNMTNEAISGPARERCSLFSTLISQCIWLQNTSKCFYVIRDDFKIIITE